MIRYLICTVQSYLFRVAMFIVNELRHILNLDPSDTYERYLMRREHKATNLLEEFVRSPLLQSFRQEHEGEDHSHNIFLWNVKLARPYCGSSVVRHKISLVTRNIIIVCGVVRGKRLDDWSVKFTSEEATRAYREAGGDALAHVHRAIFQARSLIAHHSSHCHRSQGRIIA